MPNGFPALTPAYGLGSYGRTGAALTISSPRTICGSQGRIYAYFKCRGQGYEYEQYYNSEKRCWSWSYFRIEHGCK